MKKMVLVMIMACAMALCAFAESYSVEKVSGRVQKESGNNRVEVKVGDTLSGETVIYTGVGSSLVLKDGEKTFTIPAAQNGKKVEELLTASSGVRISGKIARTDTGAVSRTTGQVSTASARASDAAKDGDIAAE